MAPERRRAFTLVEVMIGATIGSFVLAGVLSTFLLLGRSGANIVAYTVMDTQTRRAIEEFAQDVRMASAIVWNDSASVTLTVPDNYASPLHQVTYARDSTRDSATYGNFYRLPGTPSTTPPQTKTTLIRDVSSFTYYRYDRLNAEATTDAGTKRVRLNLTLSKTNRTVVTATDATVSASFIMRNKTSN